MSGDVFANVILGTAAVASVIFTIFTVAVSLSVNGQREGACYQACHSHAVVLKNVPRRAPRDGYLLCECDKPEGKLLKLVRER